MRVQIDSRYPINMSVSAADFGRLFASMDSIEQTAVLRAMIEEVETHPIQWDCVAIEMENPDNADLRSKLSDILGMLTAPT